MEEVGVFFLGAMALGGVLFVAIAHFVNKISIANEEIRKNVAIQTQYLRAVVYATPGAVEHYKGMNNADP